MHNHTFDINIKNLSKIEGHTDLDLKVREGKVESCKLKIRENKRFFEESLIGQNFNQAPTIMSRICGTCSSAHLLGCIEAIEKTFNLDVSEQTKVLRNLLTNAGHLRDHAMHLYFFCLPDVFDKDSVFDFKGNEKNLLHDGLHIKEAGNYLSIIVGGRAVHPPNSVIGGFIKFPTQEEVKEAINKLNDSRKRVLKIIDIFYKDKTDFSRKTNYVGLINKDYNFLEGQIKTAKGTVIPESKFGDYLEKVVLPYSTASGFKWESKDYMVGALARLNLNKDNLHKKTKKDCEKYLKIFPNNNIFNNNTAQAIECLHIIDSSIELLKREFKEEKPLKPQIKESTGVGVVEAPRGTLYYKISINKLGKIIALDLCIPTQQNIIHLEKDISSYVEQLLKKNKDKSFITREIEKMIRAYDPCMSCATHFLRVNWV